MEYDDHHLMAGLPGATLVTEGEGDCVILRVTEIRESAMVVLDRDAMVELRNELNKRLGEN